MSLVCSKKATGSRRYTEKGRYIISGTNQEALLRVPGRGPEGEFRVVPATQQFL